MTLIKITTSAAVLGMAAVLAMPVSAAPNRDDCIARFTKESPKGDMDLKSDTGKRYTQVATEVDVNKDGKISQDEYIVACTKDVFKDIQ